MGDFVLFWFVLLGDNQYLYIKNLQCMHISYIYIYKRKCSHVFHRTINNVRVEMYLHHLLTSTSWSAGIWSNLTRRRARFSWTKAFALSTTAAILSIVLVCYFLINLSLVSNEVSEVNNVVCDVVRCSQNLI